MAEWVRLCGLSEAPEPDNVMEAEAAGVAVCLANVEGRLLALDNVCPHRQGPLGQGYLDGKVVVCPWHSWGYNCETGVGEEPEQGKIAVFPVKVEGGDVLVNLELASRPVGDLS